MQEPSQGLAAAVQAGRSLACTRRMAVQAKQRGARSSACAVQHGLFNSK